MRAQEADLIGPPESLSLSECLRRFPPEAQELSALHNLVDCLRMVIRAKEEKLKQKRRKPRDFTAEVKPFYVRPRITRATLTMNCRKRGVNTMS